MYAKFNNGEHPSIILRPNPDGYIEAFVAHTFIPFSKLETVTKLYTGSSGIQNISPYSYNCSEIESFRLLEYDIFDLLTLHDKSNYIS